jgi:hypothetical protein
MSWMTEPDVLARSARARLRKTVAAACCAAALSAALALPASRAAAQQAPAVTIVPGPQYEADGLERALLGSNWRVLWTTPVRAPVLDLATFAGGLEMERQGGGNQSLTLHMLDARGRGWVFRSIDKFPANALPEEFEGSLLGDMVADQISALHPGGHFIMPRLLDAVGILHVQPMLYVLPDDPRLGEFRETFAGMLGELEEKPEEGPDNTPGFAGSRKVKGSANFLDDLEDSPAYRLDEHEFLRARLVDFMVGDPDRGSDQWRWARFGEEGAYVYRPVPRDRDWAFMRASGPVSGLGRVIYPKIVEFGRDFDKVEAYTYGSHLLDRRLLTRLTRADFVAEAARVQAALTDDVIAAAVADMPPEFHAAVAAQIVDALRTRRARLPAFALEFYHWLASDVDVRGTDEDDVASIERRDDGTVLVRLTSAVTANGGSAENPHFERVFVPGETREVRVYLQGGDDTAVVSGSRSGPIIVRVVGGGGDDTMEDRTGVARFYDHRGSNEFITAAGTQVDTRPWDPPEPPEGLRVGSQWAPEWGGDRSLLNPALALTDAGLIVGVGPSLTRYGFRRLPYHWSADVRGLYAPESGGLGATLHLDYRYMNSRRAFMLDARATQFDVFRFYGFGNDTEELDDATSRVLQDRFDFFPALAWHIGVRPGAPRPDDDDADEPAAEDSGIERPFDFERLPGPRGLFTIGPALTWTRARPPADNPLHGAADGFGQLGGRARFSLWDTDRDAAPRRGYRLSAEAAAYPAVWDAGAAFGAVGAEASGYLPLVGQAHAAVRLGGRHAFGEFPVFEAAFVGGRQSLRGYRSHRFAGDAAAYGSAELRVPLGTVRHIVSGELGVFGLADAARVWYDGASPGGIHTAFGGGFWFAAFDRAISAAYAHGERGRFYVWSGLPF